LKSEITTPKGILKVEHPDHPFTYTGPDVLYADRPGLVALFKIRENEQRNASKLFSRITNALIAYPPNTKMLLLIEDSVLIPSKLIERGKNYLDEFIEPSDIRRIRSLMRDKKSETRIQQIKYTQKKLFSIQAQIQKDNLDYIKTVQFKEKKFERPSFLNEKAKYYSPIDEREIRARANIFSFQNNYYGVKKLSRGISDLVELQPFFEFVINAQFQVDDRIPFFKYVARKVLNISDVPRIRYDPIKPIRVASLFGWHLVNANNFEDLEIRMSKFIR